MTPHLSGSGLTLCELGSRNENTKRFQTEFAQTIFSREGSPEKFFKRVKTGKETFEGFLKALIP